MLVVDCAACVEMFFIFRLTTIDHLQILRVCVCVCVCVFRLCVCVFRQCVCIMCVWIQMDKHYMLVFHISYIEQCVLCVCVCGGGLQVFKLYMHIFHIVLNIVHN